MRRQARSAGFSLIEVLVSMLIALLTFLVMLQMFENWDRSKRTTASGGGALVSGAVGMFRLERDLRLAGFGFGGGVDLGCTVTAFQSGRPDAVAAGPVSATVSNAFSFPLTALQIVDGASGAPDQLVVLYGSAEGVTANNFFSIASAGGQPFTDASSSTVTMNIGARAGIRQGDLVVVAQDGGTCSLVEVTDTSNGDRRTFGFGGANYTHAYTTNVATTPRYNRAGGITINAVTGRVYVFGPMPQRRIWQIRDRRTLAFVNDLAFTDAVNNTTGAAAADNANDFVDVADNVINLQAQYGIATTPGSAAELTCTPVNNPTWTTTAPAAACQPFIWAVRVAVLARSDQFEKTWGVAANAGSAVAPSWVGGTFTMTNLDGTADSFTTTTQTAPSGDPNDWRHYRYKVFESVIPLKNNMWGSRT